MTTLEAELPRKVINAKPIPGGEKLRRRAAASPGISGHRSILERRAHRARTSITRGELGAPSNCGRSVLPARVQYLEPDKEDVEADLVAAEVSYSQARK